MTLTLRKIHRYTWFSLAILLPLGWLAAIEAIPDEIWQTPIRSGQTVQLSELIASKESGDFVFNLRQDSSATRQQIEIWIKKPLTSPSTTVILETGDSANGKKEQLLGLLGSRGVWRFNLDSVGAQNSGFSLRLEDKIQHRTLRTIAFPR